MLHEPEGRPLVAVWGEIPVMTGQYAAENFRLCNPAQGGGKVALFAGEKAVWRHHVQKEILPPVKALAGGVGLPGKGKVCPVACSPAFHTRVAGQTAVIKADDLPVGTGRDFFERIFVVCLSFFWRSPCPDAASSSRRLPRGR